MTETPADLPTTLDQAGSQPETGLPSAIAILGRLSPGQIIGLGMSTIGLLGFFSYLAFRIAEPDYSLLYGGLDLEDSAEIVTRLEALGVSYELYASGEGILVPADRVARLRMTMAEEGLPRGGSVGDEIFDQAGALGTTTFLANINQRRALEGELARTIAALKDVKSARIHLVLPKRELFRREQIEPSASVTLRMFSGRRLDQRQVAAVQHLVAAAVPGLQPDRITLVDDRGTLLVRGGETMLEGGLANQADDYRIAHETRLKRVIEQLLERSLGPGRVHAEVNADIDFDQVTTTEETFDPDGQVVRSTQSIEEETELAERDDDGTVTVGNNLPNTDVNGEAGGRTNNENSVRTEETVNYEISRTVRNHTQVGGRIKRLSVAVLVGGREVAPTGDETPAFRPLEQVELDEIASLVRSAIGFDEARGDSVEIKNLPFVEPAMGEIEVPLFDLTRNDIMRLAELGALLLLAVIAIFLVVRPTLAKLMPEPVTLDAAAAERAMTGRSNLPVALDSNGQTVAASTSLSPLMSTSSPDQDETSNAAVVNQTALSSSGQDKVDLAEFDDPKRIELIQQVRNIVEARPDDAVAVIRQWMKQEEGTVGA